VQLILTELATTPTSVYPIELHHQIFLCRSYIGKILHNLHFDLAKGVLVLDEKFTTVQISLI